MTLRLSCLLLAASCSGASSPAGAADAPTGAAADASLVVLDAPAADAPLPPVDAAPTPDAPLVVVDARGVVDAPVVDAPPPDAALLVITGGADIPVAGRPVALVENATTMRLYASLATPPGQPFAGAGIAVIDESTHTVLTTIPAPKPSNSPLLLDSVAVDETTNRIYVASSYTPSIFVVDGGTNGLTTTPIALGSKLPTALAVDAAAHRLYVLLQVNTSQVVAVYDEGTSELVTSIPIAGIANGGQKLALDVQNHLLFACGYGTGAGAGAAVQAIDTTTNMLHGDLTTFPAATVGYYAGCKGGPGYASLLTNGTSSAPAVLHELEPAEVPLPEGFVPDTYAEDAIGGAGRASQIYVFGHSTANGEPLYMLIIVQNEHVSYRSALLMLSTSGPEFIDHLSYLAMAHRVSTVNQEVYVAQTVAGDGGPDVAKLAVTVFFVR